MPDVKGINSDSASLGTDLPGSFLNQDLPWRPREKKKPVSFRKGEIIHGEITEIISSKEAFVRLPSGILRALVAGNLKKGDSLFFQVQETEPYLVLKIFSSQMKKDGLDIPEDELVRILDLPDNDFFKSIITFYREKKSVITRDDIFNIEKTSSKISKDYLADITMKELFSIVFFMQENNLQQTSANFQKLKPAFRSPGMIHDKMLDLERQIDIYPVLSSKYQAFFDGTRDNDRPVTERIKLLNSIHRNPSLLSSVLKGIEKITPTIKIDEHLLGLLSFFWQFSESAAYLKKSSEDGPNLYFLFVPVNINMFFTIARFTVRNIQKGEQLPQKAGLKLMDIMNSIIQTDSFMEDEKTLRHGLFSQSEKACRILGEKINNINTGLVNIGIESVSVLVSNFPDDDFEIALKSSAGQMKNFSIVV
jgi:hypothetical protein